MAFFLSALIVIAFTPKVGGNIDEYIIGAVAAFVGAVVEAGSWKIDDNLSVPLSVGVVMWGLYFIMYPSVNLFALTIH